MLPIVEKDDIFPETFPTSFNSLSLSLTANGETVAKKRLGTPNVKLEQITATKLELI